MKVRNASRRCFSHVIGPALRIKRRDLRSYSLIWNEMKRRGWVMVMKSNSIHITSTDRKCKLWKGSHDAEFSSLLLSILFSRPVSRAAKTWLQPWVCHHEEQQCGDWFLHMMLMREIHVLELRIETNVYMIPAVLSVTQAAARKGKKNQSWKGSRTLTSAMLKQWSTLLLVMQFIAAWLALKTARIIALRFKPLFNVFSTMYTDLYPSCEGLSSTHTTTSSQLVW